MPARATKPYRPAPDIAQAIIDANLAPRPRVMPTPTVDLIDRLDEAIIAAHEGIQEAFPVRFPMDRDEREMQYQGLRKAARKFEDAAHWARTVADRIEYGEPN